MNAICTWLGQLSIVSKAGVAQGLGAKQVDTGEE